MDYLLYKRPPASSKDAYHIWNEAGLPEQANKSEIYAAIDLWAVWYAYIYKKIETDDNFQIQWVTPGGYIIKTSYETFVKWIICSCSKVQPPFTTDPKIDSV
jgi:hypothetical protein